MGILVPAAGMMLGGLAAQKLMGKPTTYGADTSIPGISSATIKKGGKGQPDETVPQVDISKSLQWFDDAAKIQEQNYTKGLQYYQSALVEAGQVIQAKYREANSTLKPLSYSSNQALNEQMRMMGLDPIQAAYSVGDQLRATADIYRNKIPGADVALNNIANKMDSSLQIKDPAAREQARQSILNEAKGLINTTGQAFDTRIEAARQGAPAKPAYDDFAQKLSPQTAALLDSHGMSYNDGMFTSQASAYDQGMAKWQESQTAWEDKLNAAVAAKSPLAGFSDELNKVAGAFDTQYAKEYDSAYTGKQIEDRVASTPGYQFQMEQGTKAIERTAAAKGNLLSGNTLTAATNYGQGLAQNFYGVYMDNLARIVNEGSPATMQISQNQVNEGKDYGTLIEAGGQAGMQTSRLIGDAYAQSNYNKGNLYADAAKFNAQMQYAGIAAGKGQQAQMAQQAIQSGPGYMNAQTAANQQQYGIFQNQQGGAAYAAANQGGTTNYGNYSFNPSTGWKTGAV